MWSLEEDFSKVTRTEDLRYINMLKFNFKILGGWPATQIGSAKTKGNLYKIYIIMLYYVVSVACEIKYLITNTGRKTFLFLGHSYITTFMCVVAAIRYFFIHTRYFRKATRQFIQTIHLYNHRNKSAYYMEVHLLVHKLSHFFSVYLLSMMSLGIIFFNVSPLYGNFSSDAFNTPRPDNITFEHSVYYALPFDYTTDLNGYIVIFIFNWWTSLVISITFCAMDLLIYLIVFHLWGHLKILIHNLECFPKPTHQSTSSYSFREPLTFSQQEMNEIKDRLIKCILHHKLIIGFTTNMFDTFGWILALNYCFHQVVGCLLLLECSQMDVHALTRYGPLTLLVFQQLIQISFTFELLGSKSDNLSDVVYNLPWEYMDQSNRKLVLTFLRQSQKSMYLKAMDMITIGVQTMATILKNAMSYFLMLHTVAQNEI